MLWLHFRNVGEGLVLNDNPTGFQIASESGPFTTATVNNEGDSLLLSNPSVLFPRHARYQWNTFPQAELSDSAGWATPPFRTDLPPCLFSIQGYEESGWASYPVLDGIQFNAGSFLGWLNIEKSPWVYCYALDQWVYLPESHVRDDGAWVYIAKL